jgi:hypothetical protein
MARTPFYGRGPGPQIARMDMQAATAPGKAIGGMFANLGKIGADSLEKFRENKEKKESEDFNYKTAKGYLNNNPELAKQYFDADDEDEIEAVARGVSKTKDFSKFITSLNTLQQQFEQDKKLKATENFAMRMSGMTPNPRVTEIDAKLEEERQGLEGVLATPQHMGKSGIPGPKPKNLASAFEQRIKTLEGERAELGADVPMSTLGVNPFIQAMGTPKTPHGAMLMMQEVNRRQTREDSMVGKGLDFGLKKLQIGQMVGDNMGDNFASGYSSPKAYYFDESQARKQIMADAKTQGVVLDKEQLDTALSGTRVIDMKDLRSSAEKQVRELKLVEPISILEASQDLTAFLDEGGPLSGNVAKEKLARMVQPIGILTEDDLRRVGGAAGLRDRIDAALEKVDTGTVDETTEEYLRNTAEVFRSRAATLLRAKQGQGVAFLSKSFGITPGEVNEYTQFGQTLKNIPAGVAGSTSAPSNQVGSKRLVFNPYSGKQESLKIIGQKPDGILIIESPEGLIEVDPLD